MALVVSATSKLYSGFSPTSIPGCVLWLDAADASTVTFSGSNVSEWKDKSSNAYTFNTAPSGCSLPVGGDPINGRPTIGITTTTMGIKQATILDGLKTVVWIRRERTGNRSYEFYFGADGSSDFHTGTSQYAGSGFAQNAVRDASLNIITSNGVVTGTLGSTAVSSSYAINILRMTGLSGSTRVQGLSYDRGNTGRSMMCDWGEVLFYTTALTSTQLTAVESYLATKWAVQSYLPSLHPYRSLPVVTRPLLPVDISGCLIWVDGQDPTSYTLSSTNVTTWNDKSGNGNNFSRISSGPTVSNLNGRGALYIGGGGAMRNSTVSIPTSYSVFAIANRVSGQDYQYVSKFHVATDGYFFFGTSNGNFATFAGNGITTWWDVNGNSPSVAIGSTPTIVEAVNNGTTITPYTNGVAQNTKTGTTATATGLMLGSDRLGGQTLNGSVGEFIIINRPVDSSERQQLEGYLAWRWGRVADLATSHPFKRAPPLLPVFTPLQVGSCALWMDADDKSTITMSGSNIGQWRDKSGNGYIFDTAPSGCSLPVVGDPINGRSTIGITTTTMGIKQTTVIDGLKTIFWIRRERTGNRSYEFYFGADGSSDFHTGTSEYAGSGLAQNGVRDAAVSITTASNVVTGTLGNTNVSSSYAINILRVTGLTGSTRVQGFSYDRGNAGRSMICDWGEILFYTSALSESELTAVEGYLAQKWGIQSYLPAAHRFKRIAP